MKYLLVIGDGMADDPVPQLGNRTPLQAASIPAIDRMAARGLVGSVVNCPPPLPAGSETAILSIFGCDPRRYFTGRSPMEAAAVGIPMAPGDAAFRCNLVSFEDGDMPLEEKRLLSHSAGSIDGDSALAAVAGVLYMSSYPILVPTTGSMPGIKAFTAAVFGGIGSIPGALLGGLLLGIIEIFAGGYISTQLQNAIVFAVLIVVLLVKPTGLLGKQIREKV